MAQTHEQDDCELILPTKKWMKDNYAELEQIEDLDEFKWVMIKYKKKGKCKFEKGCGTLDLRNPNSSIITVDGDTVTGELAHLDFGDSLTYVYKIVTSIEDNVMIGFDFQIMKINDCFLAITSFEENKRGKNVPSHRLIYRKLKNE